MRFRKRRAGIAAISVFAVFIAGCGSAEESQTSRGIDVTASVDPNTGRVVLPADRFNLTEEEQDTLLTASSGATAACARNAGLKWTGWLTNDGDYSTSDMWDAFGPWTPEMAKKFGFVTPMTSSGLITQGIIEKPADYEEPDPPNIALTEAEIDKVGKRCRSDAGVKKFSVENVVTQGPWDSQLGDTSQIVRNQSDAKKIFSELKVCYAAKGMEFDDSRPGYVVGADSQTIDETQISLALKVAECQTEVDSTNRLATLMAEYQAPIIEKYADELVARRAAIDKVVAEAKDYIAANPDLFQEP